jgi:glucan phosphoethanolaminetransferase (alkaline phosphatase superfamily)
MQFTGLKKTISGFLSKLSYNTFIALTFTGLFLITELYLYWLGRLQGVFWQTDDIGYIVIFFLFLRLLAAPGYLYLSVLILIQILQLSEISYFLFTGTYYGPAELALLSRQYKDFWGSLQETVILLLVPATIIFLTALVLILIQLKTAHKSFQMGRRAGYLLLMLWLAIPLVHAYTEDNSMRFDPDPGKTAFRNGINAFSYYTVWDLFSGQSDKAGKIYQPYEAMELSEPLTVKPVNLVIIMGESITYTHMGLYDYKLDTTPFLNSLRNQPGLIFRPAISSAVSTHVSIPMFYNIQYEPDNRTHIASGATNLYRLAKSKGFQTVFISSQEMYAIASQVSHGNVDIWMEQKHLASFPGKYDDRLLSALDNLPIDWDRRFLITLNPRAGHIPYAKHVPEELLNFSRGLIKSDYHRYMQATYDDAMHYFDHVAEQIVTTVQQHTSNPTIVVITSDHGQRLGETTGYGHNTLEFGSARVPFIYYGIDTPREIDLLAENMGCLVTHYEIGHLLAHLIGYRVYNPNEIDQVYYMNGIDISGRGGHLRYSKTEALEDPTHTLDTCTTTGAIGQSQNPHQ